MSLGIPYMGSKRKLSKKIVNYILEKNPDCKYFYDLFGGGGAVSFEALQRLQIKKVYYNELNTGVVELLKKIQKDGVTKEFYNWIDRYTFKKYKDGECWKSGLIKTCWSFGNCQNYYLFGKHIEEYKRLLHEIVVNNCSDSLKKINSLLSINIPDDVFKITVMTERRLFVLRYTKSILKIDSELQQLQHLQHLQHLQQLEKLQQFERLEQLNISNYSYENVKIETPVNETIIYLDPPYEKTGKYQNDICHRQLEDYINNSPYKIYVSSYDFNLPVVSEWTHRSTLSQITNKKVTEKLFCNREEKLKDFWLF